MLKYNIFLLIHLIKNKESIHYLQNSPLHLARESYKSHTKRTLHTLFLFFDKKIAWRDCENRTLHRENVWLKK